jgi:uncharacterized protein (TIGR00255 family)
MANSMTAFARETSSTEWGAITCELRSVNHRHLEINPRLSEELRRLEPQIREAVSQRIRRGRIDCYLRLQVHETTDGDFTVDRDLLSRMAALGREIQEQFPHLSPLSASDVLRWPGVIQTRAVDADLVAGTAMDLVRRALDRIETDRVREGDRLKAAISDRLDEAIALAESLKARIPDLTRSFRQRVTDRIAETGVKVDAERLEQELVIYVQKSDVAEEIDRLHIHLDEVRDVLGAQGAIGRRLDFLMQELNREANTLGSKAFDVDLTQASLDLKVLIEQMREQIQNIE